MILFRQETGYTCACATARMLIEHFHGIEKTEYEIEVEMKTNRFVGSSTADLMAYLKKHEIESDLISNSTLEELKSGDEIKLLLYTVHHFPHVGIIESITEDGFVMYDPCDGIYTLKFEDLKDSNWRTDENKKSFIKLRKKP